MGKRLRSGQKVDGLLGEPEHSQENWRGERSLCRAADRGGVQ